jgi:hypothetical protein
MSGFMQACFFFGYNFIACYAFFLMLGTVGWWASHLFVFRIFQAVKVRFGRAGCVFGGGGFVLAPLALVCPPPIHKPVLGSETPATPHPIYAGRVSRSPACGPAARL